MQFSYLHIGKIVASFGTTGEVIVTHALGKKSNFKDVEVLFVEETKGSKLPYFIEKAKAKTTDESYLKLEGINSKEATKRLLGKPIWLTEDDARKLSAKQSTIGLIGYTVFSDENEIGIVIEVIEQPHQTLLNVDYNGKEVYIPMHQDNIVQLAHPKKKIVLEIPDGLLDL